MGEAAVAVTPEVTPAVVPGPTPAIDPAVFTKMVREEVQHYMETEDKGVTAPGYGSPVRSTPVATENPLQAVIEPIVGPAINRARLEGMGARDAVTFFASHPEATKYAADLNKAFEVSLSQGTPYNYDTLWAWYRGRPENFDKFVAERVDADKAKVAKAKDAEGVDGTARVTPKAVQAESLDQAKLTESLKDVAF